MIDLFSIQMILFYAVLYGVAMKIGDLLDEHGLRWFRGSSLLFGAAYGLLGAALIFSDAAIANIILAMSVAFLIRRRIDYLNHALAETIIIMTFLFHGSLNPALFLVFYFIFFAFGGLKDYVDDVMKKRSGLLANLNEAMLYYPVPTFLYCLVFGNWIVFYVFLLYTISYDITKYIGVKRGYD